MDSIPSWYFYKNFKKVDLILNTDRFILITKMYNHHSSYIFQTHDQWTIILGTQCQITHKLLSIEYDLDTSTFLKKLSAK